MSTIDQNVPAISPVIAMRLCRKPVCRSAHNVPQMNEDESGVVTLANEKQANGDKEVSKWRRETISDISPTTSIEVPSVATVEGEMGACVEERVKHTAGGRRKKLARTED